MIHTVVVPIKKILSDMDVALYGESAFIREKVTNDHTDLAVDFEKGLLSLNQSLEDGYEIVDTYEISNGVTEYRYYIMFKAKETTNDDAGIPITFDNATAIEGKETFSKSHNKTFRYWTLHLLSGEIVNVFDHPDPKRNTFSIIKESGWEEFFLSVEKDQYTTFDEDVLISMVKDGDWYKLDGIEAKE